MFFLMAITYKHLERQTENSGEVTVSYEVSLKLEKLYSNLKDIETERRNIILNDMGNSRPRIKAKMDETSYLLAELNNLLHDRPDQLAHLDALEMMVHYKYNIVNNSLEANFSFDDADSMKHSLLAGRNVMDSIHDKMDEMLSAEKKLLDERKALYLFSQKSTPVYLYIISLFSLGLFVFIFYRINKDMRIQKKINHDLKVALDTAQLAEKVGVYGIWMLDLETRQYHFSDNQYRLLGFEKPEPELGEQAFFKNVHPEDLEFVKGKFMKMIQTGSLAPFRYRILKEDQSIRYFHVVGKTVHSPDENLGILGITMDVTSEIENQIKLEEVNTLITDKNRTLNLANKTFEEAEKIGLFGTLQWIMHEERFVFSDNLIRLFGFDPNNFEHHPASFEKTVHPQDLQMVLDKITAIAELQDISPFTFRIFRNSDNKLLYIDVNCKIIQSNNGEDYYLFILQDATDEVLAKTAIEDQNRILEAKNAELQAFNYFASHDLQEPLRKIQTFISRLVDKDYEHLSDAGKQYLERIQFSSGRMRSLIKDLLQFSRTTSAEQVFEQADLNQLLLNALDELHDPIEEKKAMIQADSMPVMNVIPFQIQQLFINLIGNSIKYSREDIPPRIIIEVSTVLSDDEPLLAPQKELWFHKMVFTDNGIGFEQQYTERIFTLFSRLHGKLEYEGTGIGLAICRKVVENHSGFIFAKGVPGQGAVFTVYLPAG